MGYGVKRKGLIGKKLGMTQIFDAIGNAIPVTVVELGPCTVAQVKTKARDGYSAIQVGFGKKPAKNTSKAEAGHFAKANVAIPREVCEFRISEDEEGNFKVGDVIAADLFAENDIVDVTGTSKGRGFTGVMKRHNFAGFPASHGTHEFFRHGGSIGCRTTPGRTMPGKRMAGHMGHATSTTQNLRVVKIMKEKNAVFIAGAIPGPNEGFVVVQTAIKHLAK